jgi:hypothetical protein
MIKSQSQQGSLRPTKRLMWNEEEDGLNPFVGPEQEDIYGLREYERKSKIEEKRHQSGLKVWHKKTASTGTLLKRVNESDIAIPDKRDNATLYNPN